MLAVISIHDKEKKLLEADNAIITMLRLSCYLGGIEGFSDGTLPLAFEQSSVRDEPLR